MNSKAKMFLARLLIVFSIIFIGIGILLTFFGDEKLLHPISDVTIIASTKNETISITTTSADENDESIVENNVSITNIPDNSNIGTGGNVPSTNINQVSPNISSEDVNNAPTVKEVNSQLRKYIQDTYGVVVKYGSETDGYSVGGMKAISIGEDETNRIALVNLNLALSLYPNGFFTEVKNKGYPLTFYLIKRYSKDNVTGVTDSTYNNVVISIATDYDFADTFHHEVYHYIEKYMFSLGTAFTSWDTLNPVGFSYGVIDSAYSYSLNYSEDAFFVNSYAMTDQYEDRASTFEYMMKGSKASCLNYGKTVWLKARTMSEQIDYFFNTVTPSVTEYWERHIY